jgi:beta-glucosidase
MRSRCLMLLAAACCVSAASTPRLALSVEGAAVVPPVHSFDIPEVETLLKRMTIAEKIALLHGAPEPGLSDQGEAGYLPGVPRLGIPPLRFSDGPPGVLTRFPATALTATMGLAATFSREDAHDNGAVIARDAHALGIDLVLEPFINLHRDPTFARAYNTLGEDPVLTGTLGAALIRGIQEGGILAQAKHFIAYDGANDVRVGDQALHELYLAPFAAAVTAGVASIMCSYNLVDGAHACGNRLMLTQLLRGELHFTGFVTSDWGAVHDTSYINAGLDLEMPGSGTTMTSYLEAEPPPLGAHLKALEGPAMYLMPEEQAPPTPVSRRTPSAVGSISLLAAGAAATAGRAGSVLLQRAAWTLAAPTLGLGPALRAHQVSPATIDRAAARILAQMARFGLLGRRGLAQPSAGGTESAEAMSSNETTVRRTAADAAVLLKNEQQTLPLQPDDLTGLAVIGPGAVQTIAVGVAGEKALGRVQREVAPSSALTALGAEHVLTAVADDMSGTPIPAPLLAHAAAAGSTPAPGLERLDADGAHVGTDAQLDFTLAHGSALPPGTRVEWRGMVRVPTEGNYWLYLQALGASATLAVDGVRRARTGPLDLHGNVLQPAQDSVLPTRDGLDNVRTAIRLSPGWHALSVQVHGEPYDAPVQIRLAWSTPEQRRADYRHALDVARQARKVLLFAWSRGIPTFALPGDQDHLIEDVAVINPNTVVVLNVGEPIAMPWLDKVKAVLLMWYPGDEGGPATADVLLGRVSPAGRLPFTWPRRLQDNVANDPAHPERSSSGVNGQTIYSEGILIGYRWFDQQHIEPLYPFGYGLSYTRFDYVAPAVSAAPDGGLEVSFELRNAGNVAGDEVPQVYLGAPDTAPAGAQFAPRALAQFTRVHLNAGQSMPVRLHIDARALEFWSSTERAWRRAAGRRMLYVAASSRDVRLQMPVMVRAQ